MYDVENNAVRILAATLREAGHHVTEIYFKDWISNHLGPATETEYANLVKVVQDQEIDLLCVSIRASAYYNSARLLTEHLHETLDVAVLWGGMHPTLLPHECIETADIVLKGEGEMALKELADRLRDGQDFHDVQNLLLYKEDGEKADNSLRALVTDLDTLSYRDYHSHDHKFFVYGNKIQQGDPMHGDPVYQMMGSRGCIYKCSYCYNSTYKKDIYPGQKWFRVRSPQSMVDEINAAREHWDFKRVRFDDEVFNFQRDWLREFCEIYMGIQSSERVTGHLYDRRVKNQTIGDIANLYHSLGIKPHFQLIFDDPVSTDADRKALFNMVAEFPRPYDLYLFSMTVFPGSELNHKLIENGVISEYDVEGVNTRVFYQHRVNLEYPRPVEETFWITLIQMLSKDFIPRPLLKQLSKSRFLKQHPWPLIKMAHMSNYVKMGTTASKMIMDGEMTPTLWRRWASTDRVITT
jgi:hypothetical protein